MRTPLTAIIGSAEIFSAQPRPSEEDRQGMVRDILQATGDLGRFLDDAFEFLQRTSGSLVLQKVEFDVVPHLQRSIRERSAVHVAKRIRVAYRGLNSSRSSAIPGRSLPPSIASSTTPSSSRIPMT